MEKNVLLFFMSKYNALSKENVYEYNGSQVIANHTNMGPTRALISYLNNEEGEKRIEIVYLASKTVRDNNDDKRFEKELERWRDGECKDFNIMFTPVPVDDQFEDGDIINDIIAMTKNIGIEDKVYIDLSGGIRQAAFALLAVGKILIYKGVKNIKVLTNQFNPGSNYTKDSPLMVSENTSVSGALDYVSAIQSFIKTGDVCELEQWFGGEISYSEKGILDKFGVFYRSISFCRAEMTFSNWKNILRSISDYEKETDAKTRTFDYVVQVLKKEMWIDEQANGQNDLPKVISLIKWCLRHNLLQQALTILDEKIPFAVTDKRRNKFLYEWPDSMNKQDKVTYVSLYDRFKADVEKKKKEYPQCKDALEKAAEFKSAYVLLVAVRNHVNHASEEENKDSVDGLFQKDDIKKIVGINSEISTMQALLDNMELVKSVIDNLLSNADEYQKAFEQVKDLKSKTGDA